GVEAGVTIAADAIDGGEAAAGDNLAVGLKAEAKDDAVDPIRDPEIGVNRPIGIQASQSEPRGTGASTEIATDNDLAVGLDGKGIDDAIGDPRRHEAQVQGAIGIKPRDARARDAAEGGEA